MLLYRLVFLALLIGWSVVTCLNAKPRVWVFSDLSDPRDQRSGGHPQNDPDDIVSMAALMLEANRFEIEGIVYSATNRIGLGDATPFVRDALLEAYEFEAPYLNRVYGGYPATLPFIRSTATMKAQPERFDPSKDYSDLSRFGSARQFVEAAGKGSIYCLCWGPLTEPAIAVKHLLDTGNLETLNNITFIAHWTMSFIAQGTPEEPFRVANCRDDGEACHYIHEMAGEIPEVKYVEVGSVGQNGIVDGSSGFAKMGHFNKSRLGQIYLHAKRYGDKPDQSDAATLWTLIGEFGVGLDHYRDDGVLDQETEEVARDGFKANGHRIVQDLLDRSNAAAEGKAAWPDSFVADLFTYVYQFINGNYYVHAPFDFSYQFVDTKGKVVKEDRLAAGKYQLDLSDLAVGRYEVFVESAGVKQKFEIERVPVEAREGKPKKVSVYDK